MSVSIEPTTGVRRVFRSPRRETPARRDRRRRRRVEQRRAARQLQAGAGTVRRAATASISSTPTGERYLDFVSGIAVNALGYADPGLQQRAARGRGRLDSRVESVRDRAGRAARGVARRAVVRRRRCSSATRARKRTKARSSSRADGRARRAMRSTRSSRCAARSTGGCSARSRRRIVRRTACRSVRSRRASRIVERDIEDLAIAMNAETAAALILEPIQGEGGVRVLDAGFVREVRALTQASETSR